MDNYKLAFIYGNEDEKLNIKKAKIEQYGENDDDSLHILYLLDFIKEKGFPQPIFKNITSRHQPEVVAFLITTLGHIVFINTTKNVEKYGKSGLFLLPKTIDEDVEDSLYLFADSIKDYSVIISYDMDIKDGILNGKEMQSVGNDTPRKLIEEYFRKQEKNKQY